MSSLAGRSISAVFWGAGGSVLRMILQVGTQVVLARLLGPAEYGVFAIGAIVIGFSGFFSDIGLAYGLIQKLNVTERDVRFVFTWQILLGSLVTGLMVLGAAPLASFFGEPRATAVVQVLASLCLINALAAPATNLLKRKLDFKNIQIAFLFSYVIGYIAVGIPMAMAGYKVWALVAAWLVQSVVNGFLLFRAARHSLKPLFWYEEARAQSAYGGTVLATNLLNWLISNIDRVIIGRVLPSREIGIYATTYNLLYNPASSILGVLQPVFFSASARIAQDVGDGTRMERGFATLVAAICLVCFPLFWSVAAIADTFILTLYGAQWASAAAVCRPLALAMPFFLLWGMATPLLWASGNASREFRTQWPLAILWGLGCWFLAPYGVVAVAWGALALFILRCGITVRMALKLLNIRLSILWTAGRGGLFLTTLVASALAATDALAAALPPPGRLLLCTVTGLLLMISCLRVAPQLIAPDLAKLLAHIIKKLPPAMATRLAFLGGQGMK